MQRVGGTSASKTLQVTNDGGAAVKITGMAATGDFSQTSSCAASLAAHGTCSISVTFMRKAAGRRLGHLTIKDNATNSPQVINLLGR
jgi:hypothetical protein